MASFEVADLDVVARRLAQPKVVQGVVAGGVRRAQVVVAAGHIHAHVRVRLHRLAQARADVHVLVGELLPGPLVPDRRMHDIRRVAVELQAVFQEPIHAGGVGADHVVHEGIGLAVFAGVVRVLTEKAGVEPAEHLAAFAQQLLEVSERVRPQVGFLHIGFAQA